LPPPAILAEEKTLTSFEITLSYLFDNGKVVGAVFRNTGGGTFKGEIRVTMGLSYARSWMAESAVQYVKNSFPIVLKPGEDLIVKINNGILLFPTLGPLSIAVVMPPVNGNFEFWKEEFLDLEEYRTYYADSVVVQTFKSRMQIWTSYKDPEPDMDYIHVRVVVGHARANFFFPIPAL
jgi:hypothetical protein